MILLYIYKLIIFYELLLLIKYFKSVISFYLTIIKYLYIPIGQRPDCIFYIILIARKSNEIFTVIYVCKFVTLLIFNWVNIVTLKN